VSTLVFLLFYLYIPIDREITNFCLFAFLSDHRNYFLACSNKLLVKNPLASMLSIHSFSAHHTALLTENSKKSISTINPA